jgi:ABC-type Mn2+/Zn2+ transport system permease subunit
MFIFGGWNGHETMNDIFQYSFIVRGLEAGVIVAIIAPLIGIFLVLII